MYTYEEAKKYLIEYLSHDIAFHLSGDYSRVGEGFAEFDGNLPRTNDSKFDKLHIGLNFWDGWQDSRNHEWRYYEGISQKDWPELAKIIIRNIEEEKEITNGLILEHFDLRRKGSMISKLRKIFKTNTIA